MQGRSIKFKRGTIWNYRDELYENNTRAGFRSHVQLKSRPVLIVSSDFGNIHSPIVNVVPLISQDKQCSVNVPIINEDGNLNYIMCNQIKTIDADNLVTYVSSVDDETMAEVEKTINMVLGITTPKIEKSLKDIENIIKKIVDMKLSQPEPQTQIDSVVESIASKVEDLYRGLVHIHSTNLLFEDDDQKETTTVTESNEEENSDTTKGRKPYGYWTSERKKEYVSNYEKYTLKWIMDTYELETEKDAKKRYSQYKWELNKGLVN